MPATPPVGRHRRAHPARGRDPRLRTPVVAAGRSQGAGRRRPLRAFLDPLLPVAQRVDRPAGGAAGGPDARQAPATAALSARAGAFGSSPWPVGLADCLGPPCGGVAAADAAAAVCSGRRSSPLWGSFASSAGGDPGLEGSPSLRLGAGPLCTCDRAGGGHQRVRHFRACRTHRECAAAARCDVTSIGNLSPPGGPSTGSLSTTGRCLGQAQTLASLSDAPSVVPAPEWLRPRRQTCPRGH